MSFPRIMNEVRQRAVADEFGIRIRPARRLDPRTAAAATAVPPSGKPRSWKERKKHRFGVPRVKLTQLLDLVEESDD